MAGHSKWANIKHRKGAQDKRRAKVFTRILREIMIAVKVGTPEARTGVPINSESAAPSFTGRIFNPEMFRLRSLLVWSLAPIASL